MRPPHSHHGSARSRGLALALLAIAACSEQPAPTPSTANSAPANDASAGEDEIGLAVLDSPTPDQPWALDLGRIPLGETAERVVRLKNLEDRAVTFRSVQAGCSCTVPQLSYVAPDGARVLADRTSRDALLVLPAGAIADLELSVDTRLAPVRNQAKLVIVRLVTDSERDPYHTLELRFYVETAFQVVPPSIDLRSVAEHAGGSGQAVVVPVGDSHLAISRVLSASPELKAAVALDEASDAPIWRLSVELPPPVRLGSQEYLVVLETVAPDGSLGRPFDVRVQAEGVSDVQVVPARLFLASDAPGDSLEPEAGAVELVSHLPGQRLFVRGSSVEGGASDRLRVDVEPVTPDESGRAARWTVRLTATADLGADALDGKIVLELDDPQFPRIEIPYLRRAR